MSTVIFKKKIKLCVSDMEEWISTGLYLSPGMKTYMSIPPQIVNKDWMVLHMKSIDFVFSGNAAL